jgi:PilZ domain
MLFFKRILKEPEPPVKPTPAVERRGLPRYPISPEFPLKAVLSFIGRDENGAPMSNTRHGWNWKGRLLDCSEEGARIQMGPAVKVQDGEPCDLKLSVQDYEITVPCQITNLGETPEGVVLGLKHAIDDAVTREGYRQLLDVVALGSTLKLESSAKQPDASGYLVEVYAGTRPSRLTVWRHPADESVMAFEFVLNDNMVRAAAGQRVEYLADIDGTGSLPATTEKCLEIGRLYQWVVPNLPADMPEEVRGFLKHYAG